jgi:hypothetical protein
VALHGGNKLLLVLQPILLRTQPVGVIGMVGQVSHGGALNIYVEDLRDVRTVNE